MSKGWLSTLQAAKRLGVSEASVRRWSDRGLLPVQRVGKRLERRFKPEHVERFAVPARPGPPGGLGPHPVKLAGQLGELGTPLAPLFDSAAGPARFTAPLLAHAPPARHACLLIAEGEGLCR